MGNNLSADNEMQRLQNAFLNNISHEIRTPLNAIIGCSDIISMPDTDADTVAEMSMQLGRHSKYLLKMLDNILIVSRLNVGLIEYRPSKFDPAFLFSYIYHSSRSMLITDPKKRDRVTYTYQNNIGDLSVRIWTDDNLICQTVNCLVDNAIKFTDDGNVTLSVSLSADCGKDHADYILEVSVSDTGAGISPENNEAIFENFKKISPYPSRIYDGAGLGLPIARSLTGILNGSLSFTSEPGKGSDFTLRIPVQKC